ncbi:exopolyphosphatase [Endozoicomonadaceae bacterium StTr2]
MPDSKKVIPVKNDADMNPELVAAIDLGSNSFHMIIARPEEHEVRPVERFGEKIQLAAGLDQDGNLSQEAIDRGLNCLKKFAQYINEMPGERVKIVGTNTLRQARNKEAFIQPAEAILGHPIDVIPGREEARLIYLGVSHTQSDDQERRLVVDIGGGSTEFIIGERFEPRLLESLHMGCVSWSCRYFPDGTITHDAFNKAYYAARLELMNIEQAYSEAGWVDSIGSSGSIKSVQQIIQSHLQQGDKITRQTLEQLKRECISLQHTRNLNFPGLKWERQSIFPAGLAILTAVFDALNIKSMRFSDGALREGVLYDMVGRNYHEDVRNRTLDGLMTRYHVDRRQSERVKKHAWNCFDLVANSWALTPEHRQLLGHAAQLHEIGLTISHTQFHKHGAYLIRNSDLLGFTCQEQKQLALLVRGHRRGMPLTALTDWSQSEARSLLRLILLLRIAILLNQIRISDKVPDYSVEAGEKSLKICFPEKWLEQHPLTDASFRQEQTAFSQAGCELLIQ